MKLDLVIAWIYLTVAGVYMWQELFWISYITAVSPNQCCEIVMLILSAYKTYTLIKKGHEETTTPHPHPQPHPPPSHAPTPTAPAPSPNPPTPTTPHPNRPQPHPNHPQPHPNRPQSHPYPPPLRLIIAEPFVLLVMHANVYVRSMYQYVQIVSSYSIYHDR